MDDRGFESIGDLVDLLSRGGEIEFKFNDRMYSVLPLGACKDDRGRYTDIYAGEQRSNYWVYITLDEVPDFTTTDGYKLKDIVRQIEVTFRPDK